MDDKLLLDFLFLDIVDFRDAAIRVAKMDLSIAKIAYFATLQVCKIVRTCIAYDQTRRLKNVANTI